MQTKSFTQLITTGKTNEKETHLFGRTERVRIDLKGTHGDLFFISVKKSRLDYFSGYVYIIALCLIKDFTIVWSF